MNKVETRLDERCCEFVTNFINMLFEGVSYLDEDVIRDNAEILCVTGASKADRSIKIESANWLLRNFSVIYLGLIANSIFRESFKDAVALEIDLASQSSDVVTKIRKELVDGPEKPSKGDFIFNFSAFDANVAYKISDMITTSMTKIVPYEDEFNDLSESLSDDDAIMIGFCMSNFAYLVRAFDKNPSFYNYVKNVVVQVKKSLNID